MEEWNDYSSDLSSHYLLTEHSQAWKVSPTKSGKLKGGDLTTESEYVRKHLGVVLANCLTEVIEKRPLDPIEYIAEWLYNYVDNRKRLIKEQKEAVELEKERQEKEREEELLKLGRPEAPPPDESYRESDGVFDNQSADQYETRFDSALQLSDAYSKPMNISIEMLKEEEIINDAEIEPPVTPISESALGEITEEM